MYKTIRRTKIINRLPVADLYVIQIKLLTKYCADLKLNFLSTHGMICVV